MLIASCSRRSSRVEAVTIDNLNPRLDVHGNFVDVHGGCLQYFDGRFYLYGNSLGTNLVDTFFNCPFGVYSSPDLKDWTFEGYLLKESPKGVYDRPYVVFNPKTKKYVLWYNWYQKLWVGQAGIAVSDTPVGPFTIVNQKAHLSGASPGDGSLFVDNDGTGYYIYTDITNDYALRVEQLTPDFLDASGAGSEFIAYGVEAPLLFRRGNLYYTMYTTLCAGCPQGSEVYVNISTNALGPYILTGDINQFSGTSQMQAASSTADLAEATNVYKSTNAYIHPLTKIHPFIHAQETWVAQLPTGGDPWYIWIADGWHTAHDGTRGHDFQYWSEPLKFNPDGSIQPLRYTPSWMFFRTMDGN
ncbi:MAG TPA: family 43 glycosylhydrolase [Verrucomicrobiae bacterium]